MINPVSGYRCYPASPERGRALDAVDAATLEMFQAVHLEGLSVPDRMRAVFAWNMQAIGLTLMTRFGLLSEGLATAISRGVFDGAPGRELFLDTEVNYSKLQPPLTAIGRAYREFGNTHRGPVTYYGYLGATMLGPARNQYITVATIREGDTEPSLIAYRRTGIAEFVREEDLGVMKKLGELASTAIRGYAPIGNEIRSSGSASFEDPDAGDKPTCEQRFLVWRCN